MIEFNPIDDNSFNYDAPEKWDGMLDLIDNSGNFQPFDVTSDFFEPSPVAVLRVTFRNEPQRYNWRHWIEGRPKIFRRTHDGKLTSPFSFTNRQRRSILLWPGVRNNTLDLITWKGKYNTGHSSSHPEETALNWLKHQNRINPGFTEAISQIRMMIQDRPCNSCLDHLKSSLRQSLTPDTQVRIKWVRPDQSKRFGFFRERHSQPVINHWNRN